MPKDEPTRSNRRLEPLGSPLVERVHRESVRLDEVDMRDRERDLKEFPAEMRHGQKICSGARYASRFRDLHRYIFLIHQVRGIYWKNPYVRKVLRDFIPAFI